MPSNQTPNYQLSQWEAGDRVQRADFNADNAKIDAALGTIPKIKAGTYTPNTAADVPYHISVGFRPKMVLAWTNQVSYNNAMVMNCAMIVDGQTLAAPTGAVMMEIENNGFYVVYRKTGSDHFYPAVGSGTTHFYLAIG